MFLVTCKNTCGGADEIDAEFDIPEDDIDIGQAEGQKSLSNNNYERIYYYY
jgi:hypothetical protein